MTQPNKHQSRTVGQIVKLPSNFMQCGVKFQQCHANIWQMIIISCQIMFGNI